jgi:hypothetical protein
MRRGQLRRIGHRRISPQPKQWPVGQCPSADVPIFPVRKPPYFGLLTASLLSRGGSRSGPARSGNGDRQRDEKPADKIPNKMKTTPETILTVSALAFVAATGSASAEILINQRPAGFAEASASIMSGWENTSDANASAEASKAAGDWFSSRPVGTFLSLSEKHPQQRATEIYAGSTFRTDQDFTIRMDLRISGNKDQARGVSFFWIDAASFADAAKNTGEAGQGQGTSCGETVDSVEGEDKPWSRQDHPGLKGYALDFDYYSEEGAARPGYTALVNLSDWVPVAGSVTDLSSDPKFHHGNGWQTVQFGYGAVAENYTLSWGYDGSSFTEIAKYSAAPTDKFASAYFGFQGGGDGSELNYRVRNISVAGTAAAVGPAAVPEPGTWAAAALLVGAAGYVRWRKRKQVA